jgi:hypothetical protein
MKRKAQPSWISPEGVVYPLHGKGHSEFAYKILINEKIGEHMSKKLPTDGSLEQKGKSGDVAKADAERELGGNPKDPRHAAALREKGWVQASDDGERMVVRADNFDYVRASWCHIAGMGSSCDSVVFAIGRSSGGASAGLCGRDLIGSSEVVMRGLVEVLSGRTGGRPGVRWSSQKYGIKYFE